MKKILNRMLGGGLLLTVLSVVTVASAQSNTTAAPWPNKTVTIISPFAAGTTSDVVARLFAQGMSKAINVQVIVDNKAGASGNIGMSYLAKAAPDGYTLGMGSITTNAINQALFSKLPFALSDFYSLGVMGITPNLLVVRPVNWPES